MKTIILKLNHLVFWWYYKRVPVFFHDWTIFESIRILSSNYLHNMTMIEGLDKVTSNASKREQEMIAEIFNLRIRLLGIPQEDIKQVNKLFGINLKGVTKGERSN